MGSVAPAQAAERTRSKASQRSGESTAQVPPSPTGCGTFNASPHNPRARLPRGNRELGGLQGKAELRCVLHSLGDVRSAQYSTTVL